MLIRSIISLCILLLANLLLAQSSSSVSSKDNLTNNWIIRIADQDNIETVAKTLGALEYEAVKIGSLRGYYSITFDSQSTQKSNIQSKLKSNRKIEWSEPNPIIPKVKKNLNDSLLSNQWHLNNTDNNIDINAFEAWDLGYSGVGVQICIVDDGLAYTHPDISPNYLPSLSFNYNGGVGGAFDPTPSEYDAHGTGCAGVAAGKGNNNTGIAGAAYDANISGIRLIAAPVSNDIEVAALTYRIDSNYIYSNSWGPFDNGAYHERFEVHNIGFQEGTNNGRGGLGSIYVWAAGNGRGNNDNINYDPFASSIYTIAVGAHGDNGLYSWYSEPGASMFVSAPSNGGQRGITTSDIPGVAGYDTTSYTNTFGGTSAATPLVSGVIALMLEANPTLTWRDVQHILAINAFKIDPFNSDWTVNGAGYHINHNYGFGGIYADSLVKTAEKWINVGQQFSDTTTLLSINEALADNDTWLTKTIDVTNSMINSLEHVELFLDIAHDRASDLEVVLIAPSGTESILATQRIPLDGNGEIINTFGYRSFMTVRNWGETPIGTWTIKIADKRTGVAGNWISAQLVLHGNESCSTPTIISNPQDIFATLGIDTFFHVLTAANTLDQSYQWTLNNVNIPNSNNDTLFISDFSAEDIGDYQVSISDTCRIIHSDIASLNFPCLPVSIYIIPDDWGGDITWSVTDSFDNIIIRGGPYSNNNTDTIQVDICLNDGCFDFQIFDTEGDGICCSSGNGTYYIYYKDSIIHSPSNGNYGSSESITFCLCETDTDGDGILDCDDLCPLNADKVVPGACGCSDQKDLSFDDPVTINSIYQADRITAKGLITENSSITFKFDSTVTLDKIFEVEQNALLFIQQEDCNE